MPAPGSSSSVLTRWPPTAYPPATGDFDLFIEPEATNARRVMAALRDFGAPLDAHGIQEAD